MISREFGMAFLVISEETCNFETRIRRIEESTNTRAEIIESERELARYIPLAPLAICYRVP